jgi:TM2 domain-containing membrane protein YozV
MNERLIMYRIIGGDGHPYGPVSSETLREWVAQNRVNATTLVQPEGSTDWKPLGQLPEFVGVGSGPTIPPELAQWDQRKSKLAAGLLGVLLGGLGVHRFYLGYVGIGVAQILVTCITCGLGWIWGFIEGILILVGTTITTDADGRPLKDP